MADNEAYKRFENEMRALQDQHLKRMKQIDRTSKLMYAIIIIVSLLAVFSPFIHHLLRNWL